MENGLPAKADVAGEKEYVPTKCHVVVLNYNAMYKFLWACAVIKSYYQHATKPKRKRYLVKLVMDETPF